MRLLRRYILILLVLPPLSIWAGTNLFQQFLTDIKATGGTAHIVEEHGNYLCIQLADSMTLELFEAQTGNIIAVTTVCAPQCSSIARVCNIYGECLFTLEPAVQSIFPLAKMDKETGRIDWFDNDDWEY